MNVRLLFIFNTDLNVSHVITFYIKYVGPLNLCFEREDLPMWSEYPRLSASSNRNKLVSGFEIGIYLL